MSDHCWECGSLEGHATFCERGNLIAERDALREALKRAEAREQIIRNGMNDMRDVLLRQDHDSDIVNDFLGIYDQAERDIEADLAAADAAKGE